MADEQLAIFRGEVLRQLIGAGASWIIWVLGFFALYRYLWYLHKCIKEDTLYSHFSKVYDLLKPIKSGADGELGSYTTPRARDVIMKAIKTLFVFLIGYHLAYSLNATYISGDISMIITVTRVMHFYKLVLIVLEGMMLFLFLVSLWLHSLSKSKGKEPKGYVVVQTLITVIALSLAVLLPLAAIVTLYTNMIG